MRDAPKHGGENCRRTARALTAAVLVMVACAPAVATADLVDWFLAEDIRGGKGAGVNDLITVENNDILVAGSFEGSLQLGDLPNSSGTDSFIVRFDENNQQVWDVPLQAFSAPGDVKLTALGYDPVTKQGVACGSFLIEVDFVNGEILAGGANPQGFVAFLNGEFGFWQTSFSTGDFIPSGIVSLPDGGVVLSGSEGLARRYSAGGDLLWSTGASVGVDATRIAPDLAEGACYIAGSYSVQQPPSVGRNSIRLFSQKASGQASGIVISSDAAVDYNLGIRRFTGGFVRVEVLDANIENSISATAPDPWKVTRVSRNGYEVAGGDGVSSGEEVVFSFSQVKAVQVTVVYEDPASIDPGSTFFDYELLFSDFAGPDGRKWSFDFSKNVGLFSDTAFRAEFPEQGGGPVNFVVESTGDWDDGHNAEFSNDMVQASPSGGGRDVFLARINVETGHLIWFKEGGGAEFGFLDDRPGGLAVSPQDGSVRFAFSSGDPGLVFDGRTPEPTELGVGVGAFVWRFEREGTFSWMRAVGVSLTEASVGAAPDIATDSVGNAYVAAQLSGAFRRNEGLEGFRDKDAGIFFFDASGLLYDFQASGGVGVEIPAAVAVTGGGQIYTGGEYSSGSNVDSRFGRFTLPATNTGLTQGFLAKLERDPSQARYIVYSSTDLANGVSNIVLRQTIAGIRGGLPYFSFNKPLTRINAVGAFLTEERRKLLLEDSRIDRIEPDYEIFPSGVSNAPDPGAPGWALARINATSEVVAPFSYEYPHTCIPVDLYLIDTGINLGASYLGDLPMTGFEEAVVVDIPGGGGVVSADLSHAGEMLSLVAGQQTGVAPGAPINVYSYNVFPSGATTYVTNVAHAVNLAASSYEGRVLAEPARPLPAVMLLSLGSNMPAENLVMDVAIENARLAGITVVISAGNQGMPAKIFTPSSEGVQPGVICVGGFSCDDVFWMNSNSGEAVDLLAPAVDVRVPDVKVLAPAPLKYATFSGTSASAAYTAGVAVLFLAQNPHATPHQVEMNLVGASEVSTINPGGIPAGTPNFALFSPSEGTGVMDGYESWERWATLDGDLGSLAPGGDDDGDGATNAMEYIAGSDPYKGDEGTSRFGSTLEMGDGVMSLYFPVAKHLYDATSVSSFKDGSTFNIERCTDLLTWFDLAGVDVVEDSVLGPMQLLLRVDIPDPGIANEFFRLSVSVKTP